MGKPRVVRKGDNEIRSLTRRSSLRKRQLMRIKERRSKIRKKKKRHPYTCHPWISRKNASSSPSGKSTAMETGANSEVTPM